MKKINDMNNLRQAVRYIPSDVEAFRKRGEQIRAFYDDTGDPLISYIQGLVQRAMVNQNYTDKDIESLVDEITTRFYEEEPAEVMVWNWTHGYE